MFIVGCPFENETQVLEKLFKGETGVDGGVVASGWLVKASGGQGGIRTVGGQFVHQVNDNILRRESLGVERCVHGDGVDGCGEMGRWKGS